MTNTEPELPYSQEEVSAAAARLIKAAYDFAGANGLTVVQALDLMRFASENARAICVEELGE